MERTEQGLTGEVIGIYRTLPARVLGWLMVAGAAVLGALTIWDVGSGRAEGLLGAVALILGIASIAWALFLRPHVVLREDGVLLANVVADTAVPFSAVDEITHQWALELHDTAGRRHSAWAVPAKRERTRRRDVDDFAETTRRRGDAGTTAQGVADEAQRALQRWRLDGGELQGSLDAAQTRLAWPPIVVLAVAICLAGVAILL
ncbi:integral membrane protein [Serinicoccus hydrothermalis]|uniref:Integral membrane protein n=1 Tax=Serinicoccus hydrothermalis TaxID=1758689 RepID=A0A1B1NGF8_9MICO|nr:hypothetical protein [Serinicoccus hydrothermalis]ANS80508.1 integral membrane protein [Serinicoccus hydrothermalis]